MSRTTDITRRGLGLGALGATMAAGAAQAQPAPNFLRGPLTIVIPYGPGGLTDVRGRHYQNHLPKTTGQPVIVQNVAGGGALVGANFVYSRPSNGQTVMIASTSDGPHAHYVLSPARPNWSWNDWWPLCMFGYSGLGFVSARRSNFGGLQAVIDRVKANPGSVTLASIGPGRLDDLYMLEFMRATDTLGKWNWVFYNSSATIQADLLSGDVHVGYLGVTRRDMIDHPTFDVLALGMAEDELPTENFPFRWPTVERVTNHKYQLLGAGYSATFIKANVPMERRNYLEWAFEQATRDPEFIRERTEYGEPPLWVPGAEAKRRIDALVAVVQEMKPLRDQWVRAR